MCYNHLLKQTGGQPSQPPQKQTARLLSLLSSGTKANLHEEYDGVSEPKREQHTHLLCVCSNKSLRGEPPSFLLADVDSPVRTHSSLLSLKMVSFTCRANRVLRRADMFDVVRRSPLPGYDVSFLITFHHLLRYNQEGLVNFICGVRLHLLSTVSTHIFSKPIS
jgi:hypothetical protein